MIRAKPKLFHMEQKEVFRNTFERVRTNFSKAAKKLNNIIVRDTLDKFILTITDAKITVKTHIHQLIITTPTVSVTIDATSVLFLIVTCSIFFRQSKAISG